MTDQEILQMDAVPVKIAAGYIGMNEQTLRCLLKQGRAPFGFAVQCDGGKWSYNISPGGLVRYKREGINITFVVKKKLVISKKLEAAQKGA